MIITRGRLIKDLSAKSGFWQKDIKVLLESLDEVMNEYYSQVNDDDDVEVRLVSGVTVACKVVPERERVDPRDGQPIVVKATVKPFCRFSKNLRALIQNQYENKNGD